jgi:uncharacterized membrane protein
MNLPDGLLPTTWLWLAHGLNLLLLLWALWRAPWRTLISSERLHVFLGSCVALMVLWQIKAGVSPGLNFHILGSTLLLLMFDAPLALLGVALVLFAVTLNGFGGWQAYSLNVLLMGALPVGISWAVWHLVERFLPSNLFIYIFVCGFFSAALSMAAIGLVSTLLFAMSGVYALDHLLAHYLPVFLLMIFPEAIVTGSFVTLLTVYRPQWIVTYDEDKMLR